MNKPLYGDEWLLKLAETFSSSEEDGKFLSSGRRNNDNTSLAGFLFRKGLDADDVERQLLSMNRDSADPLPAAELTAIVRSVARYRRAGINQFDDVSVSREFAAFLTGRVCYTTGLGWLFYQDGCWRGASEIEVQEKAKCFAETLVEGIKADPESDDAARKAAKKFLGKGKINALTDLVRSDPNIFRETKDLNARRDLLNVKNGTIEFARGSIVFREHRSEDLLTQIADVVYDPDATSPIFDRVLARALSPDVADYFLRFAGYVASGRCDQQVFGIIYGPGANGKSTLVNEIQACLGSYAVNVETSTFMAQNGSGIRNDLARLYGARLAVSSELGLGQVLDAPLMKKLTGGDRITARYLYRENFEFTSSAVPLFVTNALPIIDGGDAAMMRRVAVIGFKTVIPPGERDPSLPEKLKAERSGILNRLLEGMMDYLSMDSLRPPASVVSEIAEYGDNSDLVGRFLTDRTVAVPDGRVGAQALYDEYRVWCMSSGVRSLSAMQFKNAMLRRPGMSTKRDSKGCWWLDLTLRTDLTP